MNTKKPTGKKGKFIVIDGSDGSGKATQTKLLVDFLLKQEKPVQQIDFPRYKNNLVGRFIRESLDGKHGDFIGLDPKQASLAYAVDRYESKAEMVHWLEEGFIVVSDRYVSANQIHQGGKIADEAKREEFLGWIEQVEFGILGLPRPDIIIYLHVPLEISLRLVRDRAKVKGEDLDQAESNYRYLFNSQQNGLKIIAQKNDWVKIDCGNSDAKLRPQEDIHKEVIQKLQNQKVL